MYQGFYESRQPRKAVVAPLSSPSAFLIEVQSPPRAIRAVADSAHVSPAVQPHISAPAVLSAAKLDLTAVLLHQAIASEGWFPALYSPCSHCFLCLSILTMQILPDIYA